MSKDLSVRLHGEEIGILRLLMEKWNSRIVKKQKLLFH